MTQLRKAVLTECLLLPRTLTFIGGETNRCGSSYWCSSFGALRLESYEQMNPHNREMARSARQMPSVTQRSPKSRFATLGWWRRGRKTHRSVPLSHCGL